MYPILFAFLFTALSGFAMLFQLGLALGMPWGAYAMGGKFPGRLPPAMRVAAFVQLLFLAAMTGIVLSRAGLALKAWQGISATAIWAVVGFMALSSLMNLITPSLPERRLWAPVAIGMCLSAFVLGLTGGG